MVALEGDVFSCERGTPVQAHCDAPLPLEVAQPHVLFHERAPLASAYRALGVRDLSEGVENLSEVVEDLSEGVVDFSG